MSIAALLGLAGLALVDSTSAGTLVVPLLMLAHPRVRPGRLLVYLATISAFYFALGLALLFGGAAAADAFASLDDNRFVDWAQLVIGGAMLVGSFWPDTPWAKRAAAARESAGTPSRAQRWVDSLAADDSRPWLAIGIALTAGLVEAASMLPYLGALALIGTSDLPVVGQVGVLAAYVAVMALPALVLLAIRMLARDRLAPVLDRPSTWLASRMGGAMWWVVGILGFLLAADAASRLGLFG